MESSPRRYIYKPLAYLRCREDCRREGRETVKNQRIGEFALRLCFLMISEATPKNISPTLLLKCELNKMTPMNMTN